MDASASFRFLTLSDNQASELEQLISEAEFSKHFKTKDKVGCIKLDKSSNFEGIANFANKHTLKPADCDIFISIASDKDSEIWNAPKAVNDMLKEFDCPIVFSYTC